MSTKINMNNDYEVGFKGNPNEMTQNETAVNILKREIRSIFV